MTKASRTTVIVAVIGAVSAVIVAVIQAGKGDVSSQPSSRADTASKEQDKGLQFPRPLESLYAPTGWIGDGEGLKGTEHISTRRESADVDGEQKPVRKIEYMKRGPKGWAGIRWQHPDNNWGNLPGLDLSGAREIYFKARGAKGGEIVDFVVGGIENDTLPEIKVQETLGKKWQPYTIGLNGRDLKNVASSFGWSAAASDNDLPLVFYVADLQIR